MNVLSKLSYDDRKNLSKFQLNFYEIKPVKDFKKYENNNTIACNKDTNRIEFRKKDYYQPLERPKHPAYKINNNYNFLNSIKKWNNRGSLINDNFYTNNINLYNKNPWSIGTIKSCNNLENLPKIQQYKFYNIIKREKSSEDENLSSKCSNINNNTILKKNNLLISNKECNFISMKNRYGSHFESKDTSWIPCKNPITINNKSGYNYNIINLQDKKPEECMKVGLFDKKIANRKKGLCEFEDISNPYSSNFSINYKNCIEEFPNVFKHYNGIFSQMYDSARKNGNISVPFKKNKILTIKDNLKDN